MRISTVYEGSMWNTEEEVEKKSWTLVACEVEYRWFVNQSDGESLTKVDRRLRHIIAQCASSAPVRFHLREDETGAGDAAVSSSGLFSSLFLSHTSARQGECSSSSAWVMSDTYYIAGQINVSSGDREGGEDDREGQRARERESGWWPGVTPTRKVVGGLLVRLVRHTKTLEAISTVYHSSDCIELEEKSHPFSNQ